MLIALKRIIQKAGLIIMNRNVISDPFRLYSRNSVLSEEYHSEIVNHSSDLNHPLNRSSKFSPYTSNSNIYQFIEAADWLLNNNPKQHTYAVLAFDIGSLSESNRLYGNSRTSELITHISSLLSIHIKEPNLYCNFRENFAIFLEDYTSIDIAILVIQLSEEITGYCRNLNAKPTFGFCIAGQSDQRISSLYKRAFYAKNSIKGQERPLLANYTEIL